MEQVTQRVVEQRIRNRIMEYLLGVSEFESDPGVQDLNDLVNDWEFNINGPFSPREFPLPPYTHQEVMALEAVDVAWNRFCNATPQTIKDEEAAFALPEWAQFRTEARAALDVFLQRGKLSEDVEVD